MNVVLIIAAILGCAIFKFLLHLFRLHTYLSEIPKPQPCSWLLGHYSSIRKFKDSFPEIANIIIEHGGLIRLITPPSMAIITTDKNIIREILKNETVKGYSTYFFKPWLQEGLLTSDGTKWKERKKILSSCFGNLELMKNFIKVFEQKGNDFVRTLEKEMNNNCLNLMPLVKKYTIDVLCETALGMPMKSKYFESYTKSVENLCTIIGHRINTPHKKIDFFFRFTEDYRIQQRSLKLVNLYFDEVFEEKLRMAAENCNGREKLSFIESLIESYRTGGQVTKEDIREEVNTFMFAGFDTSSIAMAFMLYLLAHNPSVQEKVVQEQRDIFGSLEPEGPINYYHLQRMKYLELVMMETMRIYPPVPILGRMLTDDLRLDSGVVLPKSLVVYLYVYGCHHNPEYFPEPDKFIPERFENGVDPFTFIPFSTGQRFCLGKKFAILETKSCISKIVRNFKLLPPKYNTSPQLTYQITMASKNGVKISLKRRNKE